MDKKGKTKRYRRHAIKYLKSVYDHHTSLNTIEMPIACYTTRLSLLTFLLDGQFEKIELEYLSSHVFPVLKKRSICLDIGAHIGNHSLHFAQHFEKVIAFEPHPTSFKLLEINTESWNNITAINVGCSNTSGKVLASGSTYGTFTICPDQSDHISVSDKLSAEFEVEKLDEMKVMKQLESIDFIKIDIEGHETACFEGAEKLLNNHSPVIACEVMNTELVDGNCDSITFLKEIGYRYIYEFRRKKVPPVLKLLGCLNRKIEATGEVYLKQTDTLLQRQHHMVLCSKIPLNQSLHRVT